MSCSIICMVEVLGWLSSLILLLTIGKQVHKQWREGASHGVSKWLFVGQTTASAGFLCYSWLVHNWVFVVTNALMLVSALVGLGIVMHHRTRDAAAADPHAVGPGGPGVEGRHPAAARSQT